MKYKILEVHPGQIKVQFEDNSLALVGIGPEFTAEDIDDAVSNYDADFRPCLLYTSPSPRDRQKSRMPSSA